MRQGSSAPAGAFRTGPGCAFRGTSSRGTLRGGGGSVRRLGGGGSHGTGRMNDWDDAERRVEKAQELFEQRRWQEALEELRAATSINPYNGSWFFNIGLTLDELDRYEEALDAYRQALEID